MSIAIRRRGRRSNRWAERTVAGLADAARELALQERWARPERGFLQRADARAKWLAALVLLAGIGLAQHAAPLAVLGAALLGAAGWSGVPPLALLRRALPLALPVAVLVLLTAAVPAAGGADPALRIALRATASLLVTLLLVVTTRWRDLTRGLRALGAPAVFVSVLEQTRGYLVRLPLTAEETFQARRARTAGAAPAADARRFVGSSMGALLGKAQAQAEASHAAMLARGWSPDAPAPLAGRGRRWPAGDALLVAVSVLAAAALLLAEDGLGHAL